MSIKRYKVLYNSATAGTGDWVALDTRYEQLSERPLKVTLVDGDTVTLQAIVKDVKGPDKSFLTTLTDSEIASLKTYTETEQDILEGAWTYIRIVKTGTSGVALVEGTV